MPQRPAAQESGHHQQLTIDEQLIDRQAAFARDNPRGREILALHDGAHDTLHRMLNAIQPGSYIRPHRHRDPPKSEGIVLLRGRLGFLVFFDDGELDADGCTILGRDGAIGIDIRPGCWHTLIALEPDTVIYEVKTGPYDPTTDKDFAKWAPAEGDPGVAEFMKGLTERLLAVAPE